MILPYDRLRKFVGAIFAAAGCQASEHERISHYLIEANLAGHDSHGVIRIPAYIEWLRAGKVLANKQPVIVFQSDALAVMDGQFGFGQVMGEEAMKLGIRKSSRHGVAVIALRNSGHLGQIGAWALLAARANKISLHFVNTSGGGILVAPYGGINRRLSANPIAVSVPVKDGPPLVLDISTCTIAEGKIRVARNKGEQVPPDCLIDSQGRPTRDPNVFYGPPPGAILPFGGHKGYGLSVIVEMLAGALTGGSCTRPDATRVANNMLTILMEPDFFQAHDDFTREVQRFIDFVRSSVKATPGGEILMPGEIEARTRARRIQEGIELDDNTWAQLMETARSLGVSFE